MKELAIIQAKLKAPKGQYNSFGKYKYRSCEDILEAVKPILAEVGCTLTISDDVVVAGSRVYVKATTLLKNNNGETETTTAFAREEDAKKGMDASQVTGAASSYARKYALNGLFAIDDAKDSDTTNTHGQQAQQTEDSAEGMTTEELFTQYAKPAIMQANTKEDLVRLWNAYVQLQTYQPFTAALSARRKAL